MKKALLNTLFIILLYSITLIIKYGVFYASEQNFIFPIVQITSPFLIMYYVAKDITPDTKNFGILLGKTMLIVILYIIWSEISINIYYQSKTLNIYQPLISLTAIKSFNFLIFPITTFIYWGEVIHIWKASILPQKIKIFAITTYLIAFYKCFIFLRLYENLR